MKIIEDYAFYGCTGLTSFVIHDSVTSIGTGAFGLCENLSSVTIPESVKSIGSEAFRECTSLSSITIPNSVTEIAELTFYGCTSLDSVTIGNSVASISEKAFYCCSGLTSIDIPNSVKIIGESAFEGCRGLTEVFIPDSVTTICDRAFSGCELLLILIPQSVTKFGYMPFDAKFLIKASKPLGEDNENYGADKVIYGVAYDDFYVYADEGKTWIAAYLGDGDKVNIPETVVGIDPDAFYYCDGLKYNRYDNADYLGNKQNPYLALMSTGFFYEGFRTINDSCKIIVQYAFISSCELTSLTIPNSVKTIESEAFTGCKKLSSIYVPKSVSLMCETAFTGCDDLTIYCEAESQPNGWNSNWNPDDRPVVWGATMPTAVNESAANAVNIYAYDNTIIIENATDEIRVYDSTGNLICRDSIHRIRTEITINNTGIYIVKTGNVVKRVMVH